MADSYQIKEWAQSMGLPDCIGQVFADEHNGALPQSNAELCQWANSTGRRLPTGEWKCPKTDTTSTPTGTPINTTVLLLGGIFLFTMMGKRRR